MSEVNDTCVFLLAANASFQALGEGAVVLMIDSGQIYSCNETTEAFLKLVDGKRNFGEIIDRLVTEFAIDRDTLAVDFLPVVQQLRSEGILEIR
jgi:pyrroloquinoline quinone biosynthesis protein D